MGLSGRTVLERGESERRTLLAVQAIAIDTAR
jgi:hypothetical protein